MTHSKATFTLLQTYIKNGRSAVNIAAALNIPLPEVERLIAEHKARELAMEAARAS